MQLRKTFHETIKRVNAFKKQIDAKTEFKYVADSALYSKSKLLATNDYLWLTRVPETIEEAKALVHLPESAIPWKDLNEGYKCAPYVSSYGEIKQRWLLVYSEKAYLREKKTCEKNWRKTEAEIKKAIWHLGNEVCGCIPDAENKVVELRKNYSDEKMLSEYKEQQHVERGFRFLKDSTFMVDSIFLKSTKRIEALMMVMTLCLLVYNIAQYKLRKKLKDENTTLPNQLGKGPSEKGYRIQR